MPSALRSGPCRFYFYSYDCDEPRPMHVDRDRLSARFWLDPDVALAANYGFSRRELRDLVALMRANLVTLRNKWDAFCQSDTGHRWNYLGFHHRRHPRGDLEDGGTIAFPIGWYPRLAYASDAERANFEPSGAGSREPPRANPRLTRKNRVPHETRFLFSTRPDFHQT